VTKWNYNTATRWLIAQLSPRFVLANPTATTCSPPATGCTTYTHDNLGRLLVTTDANGHFSTNHYDADGNLDYRIDADNNKTSYSEPPVRGL
jgi:YD repeat-containing protein